MKCPMCRNRGHSRSWRTLKTHMSKEHTHDDLIEWAKTLGVSEHELLTYKVNWKFKVFELLWRKWRN